MVTKAVVLAAGYGTRFLPVTRVVPKELLPLVDRPCLDLVVQELVEAGVQELLVITSRRKRAIEDWFDRDPELEGALAARPERLATIRPPPLRVSFIRQPTMGGTGDALLLAHSFAGDDPVLVVFPDDLFRGPNPSAELITTWRGTGCSVLGCADLSGQDVSAYGVVDVGGDPPRVRAVIEKPAPGSEPSHLISVGRFLYTPAMFAALARHRSTHVGGEYYPMAAMAELGAQGQLAACTLSARRYDTGTPLGWLEAVIDAALARPDLAEGTARLLRQRVDRGAA